MYMAARVAMALAVASIAVAPARAAASRDLRPDIVAEVGGTMAASGDAGGGGTALSVSLLWPLEDRVRVGVMVFGDDLGRRVGRLTTPAGEDLGPVETLHREVLGAAWRMEAHLPESAGFDPFAVASMGLCRVSADRVGTQLHSATAATFGIGVGVSHRVAARHDAGIALRYQQASRGGAERWLSTGVEWRWHWGLPE